MSKANSTIHNYIPLCQAAPIFFNYYFPYSSALTQSTDERILPFARVNIHHIMFAFDNNNLRSAEPNLLKTLLLSKQLKRLHVIFKYKFQGTENKFLIKFPSSDFHQDDKLYAPGIK